MNEDDLCTANSVARSNAYKWNLINTHRFQSSQFLLLCVPGAHTHTQQSANDICGNLVTINRKYVVVKMFIKHHLSSESEHCSVWRMRKTEIAQIVCIYIILFCVACLCIVRLKMRRKLKCSQNSPLTCSAFHVSHGLDGNLSTICRSS